MKAGTTSLFDYVCQHPQVLPPERKELHHYDRAIYEGQTLEDYLARFPSKKSGQISGEATPYYLRHPHCPAWIRRDFPDVKIIAILREPGDRSYSHFNQRSRKGKEPRDLLEIIETEDNLTRHDWTAVCTDPTVRPGISKEYSYLSRSRYSEQLQNWFAHFPREQILVVFSEELLSDPDRVLRSVFEHIGVAPAQVDTSRLRNARDYEPMPARARERFDEIFAQDRAKLEDMLGRKLPWN